MFRAWSNKVQVVAKQQPIISLTESFIAGFENLKLEGGISVLQMRWLDFGRAFRVVL